MFGRLDGCRLVRGALLAAVCVFGVGLASARAEIVYDNTTNPTGVFYPVGDGWAWGDEIALDRTARVAQQLQVGIFSDTVVAADTFVSLYDNNGDPLCDVDVGRVDYPANAAKLISASLPSVALTETVSWIVTLSQYSDPTAGIGPLICDPPTVGSSEDFFWLDAGTGFGQYWFNGSPVANFAAVLTADVPEPGAVALLATGLAALGLAVRRRKRAASPRKRRGDTPRL